jgi:hypothetical protein
VAQRTTPDYKITTVEDVRRRAEAGDLPSPLESRPDTRVAVQAAVPRLPKHFRRLQRQAAKPDGDQLHSHHWNGVFIGHVI